MAVSRRSSGPLLTMPSGTQRQAPAPPDTPPGSRAPPPTARLGSAQLPCPGNPGTTRAGATAPLSFPPLPFPPFPSPAVDAVGGQRRPERWRCRCYRAAHAWSAAAKRRKSLWAAAGLGGEVRASTFFFLRSPALLASGYLQVTRLAQSVSEGTEGCPQLLRFLAWPFRVPQRWQSWLPVTSCRGGTWVVTCLGGRARTGHADKRNEFAVFFSACYFEGTVGLIPNVFSVYAHISLLLQMRSCRIFRPRKMNRLWIGVHLGQQDCSCY